ncbi:hypothetical protein [Burkholderia stagnalis]|uniref:hypothetical protein n=1 Tax=Burkholderia stagnalis TaxID=1503054 RepID=UPI000ADC6484|nr:hypothetical protein [Burkholderia stagnalis]
MKTTGKFYTTRRYRDANEDVQVTSTSADKLHSLVKLWISKPGNVESIRFEMTADEARQLGAMLTRSADDLGA